MADENNDDIDYELRDDLPLSAHNWKKWLEMNPMKWSG